MHRERPFFADLVTYITSGPVVVMALEGTDAIVAARNTIGATKPSESAAGTIRGDFGLEIGRNLVHGSDGPETAVTEIALWFAKNEITQYDRDIDRWILE